jgi:tetratricopeptide (TPR) repeat protein
MPRLSPGLSLAALLALSAPAMAQETPPADSTVDTTAAAAAATPAAPAAPLDEAGARARFDEGRALLQAGNFQGALAKFQEGLRLNEGSLSNRLGAATALEQLERDDDAVEQLDLLIATATAVGNEEFVSEGRNRKAAVTLRVAVAAAMAAIQDQQTVTPEKAAEVLPLFETVTEDVPGAGFQYQYARVLNALGRHADAIPHAQRATEAEDVTDKSAFFIELGLAYRGAGDVMAARGAFEQARTGTWAGWAEHYLRELETAPADGASTGTDGAAPDSTATGGATGGN